MVFPSLSRRLTKSKPLSKADSASAASTSVRSSQPSVTASSTTSRSASVSHATRSAATSQARSVTSSHTRTSTTTRPVSTSHPKYLATVARYCPHCSALVPVDQTIHYCNACQSPLSPYPRPATSIVPPSTIGARMKPTPVSRPPATHTSTTPASPVSGLRSPAAEAKTHPAGRQALVLPDGTPTPKLEALRDAIADFLFKQVDTGSGLVDMSRMYYLEWAWGRLDWLTLFNADTTQRLYNSLGYEYALVVTRHPQKPEISERTPALSRTGLLSFLTHEILLSPAESTERLNRLLAAHGQHIAPPPRHLGIGDDWEIAAHMMLRQPHPIAVTKQRRLVHMMRGLGWVFSNAAQWGC